SRWPARRLRQGRREGAAVKECTQGASRRTHRARLELHFETVEPADVAIDREDDAAVVDEYVVDLAGAGRRPLYLRHEIPDFLRLVRVRQIVGPEAAVEEGAEDYVFGFPAIRLRQVLPQIMRAEAAAAASE